MHDRRGAWPDLFLAAVAFAISMAVAFTVIPADDDRHGATEHQAAV